MSAMKLTISKKTNAQVLNDNKSHQESEMHFSSDIQIKRISKPIETKCIFFSVRAAESVTLTWFVFRIHSISPPSVFIKRFTYLQPN